MRASICHILPLTLIRRARMLPDAGQVLVRVGQKVGAADVVAEANIHNPHILMDVRSALRLSYADDLRKYITLRVGDRVQEGDVIAESSGLFKRIVSAPANGQIVAITSGQVMLETSGKPFQLLAGITGEVMEVIPGQGVILESHGALIQGVWGNGQINTGLLLSLANDAGDELVPAKIDMSMRGAVLMAGTCSSEEALLAAAQLPIRGLILGSMSSDLIPIAQRMEYPIVLLDGFGQIPINSVAYRILSTNEKRDVSINAAPLNLFKGTRPEIVIPLPAVGELAPEVAQFKAGQTIRIKGAPYNKQVIGTLIEIIPGLTLLPNGIRVPAAFIRLENNEEIKIPLANLDVLD